MSHSIQLQQFSQLLQHLSPLWRFRSFDCQQLPWQQDFPQLASTVMQLTDAQLDLLDTDQQQLVNALWSALAQDLTYAGASAAQCAQILALLQHQLTAKTAQQQLDPSSLKHFQAAIKGRKWQQINAFVEGLDCQQPQFLEWCAGKGHLGRLIAFTQHKPVVSLEWQAPLCADGEQLAAQWQLPQRFVCADAFALPTDNSLFHPEQHAVALHACGDLHVSLLKQVTQHRLAAVTISPCCYHLIQGKQYQPLSQVAQQADLQLTTAELQLALQQTTIASSKAKALREQEMIWRLGFDSLQRKIRQQDSYLPVPSIKQSQLSGSFKAFCEWALAKKEISTKFDFDPQEYLQLGAQRLRLIKRLDLVAHLLRAPMEHYLLLDRVCYLQEQGYQVRLSRFCDAQLTPRNAFIQAWRTESSELLSS